MTFKLLMHESHHGFGVSLTKYKKADDPLSLQDGFVLTIFDNADDRDKYVRDLSGMTGFEIEKVFD